MCRDTQRQNFTRALLKKIEGIKFEFAHLNDSFYLLARLKLKIHFCHDALEGLTDLFLIKSQCCLILDLQTWTQNHINNLVLMVL